MGRFILIDVVVALALSFFWYAWFVRYNRRRAGNVLRWVGASMPRKRPRRRSAMAGQQFAAQGHASPFLALV